MLSMVIEKAIENAYNVGNFRFIEDMILYSDGETRGLIERFLVEEMLLCPDCFNKLKEIKVREVYGHDGVHEIGTDIIQLYCNNCREEK